MRPDPTARPLVDGWSAALLLLSVPWILVGLASYSVVNGDEAVYHTIAARMIETGDWLRLEFKGEHRLYDTFMNAPIQYWARAILIGAFGSSLFTMRILSALFAVATVWMTYRFVLRLADRRSAFLSGLILLTTFQFIYLHSARTGELEPVLAFLVVSTAHLFLRTIDGGRSWIPHHLCLVLLVNLKVPIALVPLLAEAIWFVITPHARGRLGGWLRTGLLVLPFAFAWHATQAAIGWDDFLTTVGTMGGEAAGTTGNRIGSPLSNLLFYARTVLFGSFPYALAYPLAAVALLGRRDDPARDGWRIAALYAATVFLFFLAISKYHSWYIIPAYPFLSAFLGTWIVTLASRVPRWGMITAITLLLSLVAWITVDTTTFNPFATRATAIAREIGLRTSFGMPPLATLGLSVLLVCGALGAGHRFLRDRFAASLAATVGVLLVGYGAARVTFPLRHLSHRSEMARLDEALDRKRGAGERVEFPVAVMEPGRVLALYYFGDDYEVVPLPHARGAIHFLLFEPGDARIHEFEAPSIPIAAPAGAPNVILISIDTLRWDHVGLYGYARNTTPSLDRAFEDSFFEHATSPSPCTLPSVPELLFGSFLIRAEQRSLAEILRDNGYATAAIVSQHQFHLDRPIAQAVRRGFSHFDIQSPIHVDPHGMTRRRANVVSNRAIAWLKSHGDERPFFLWLHYFDPHDPYDPPESFQVFGEGNLSERTGDRRLYLKSAGDRSTSWQQAGHIFSREDVDHFVNLYDGEIRFTDHEIGRVLAHLGERDHLESSLLFVTADHGEWLGEEDRWDHCQTLHEREIRVPLLARLRGRPLVAPENADAAVSTIDIVPTVLGVLGLERPRGLEGSDLRAVAPGREVFSVWKGEATVRDEAWKLLSEGPALYEVASDPYERTNRIDENDDVRSALEGALRGFLDRVGGAAEAQDRAILEQLRALGYVE